MLPSSTRNPAAPTASAFPEAPGCFSAADRVEEIVPNAIEALALFFEDGEEGRPRGLEAVREEAAEDLAAGAFLMMIPHLPERRRTVRVNLSLDKGLLDTLDEAAKMRRLTRSAFIAKAAAREIQDPAA